MTGDLVIGSRDWNGRYYYFNLKDFISKPLIESKSKAYDSSAAGKRKHTADNYFYLNQRVVFTRIGQGAAAARGDLKLEPLQ